MITAERIARIFRGRSRRELAAGGIAAVLAVYALTYAANSAAGGYWPLPDDASSTSQSLGEPDDILWQPRFGYASARWSSSLGIFYAPLIRLDRACCHKTRGTEDDGAGMYFQSSRPLTDFHPEAREYVRLSRALYARHAKRTREELETEPDFIRLRAENERLLADSGRNPPPIP